MNKHVAFVLGVVVAGSTMNAEAAVRRISGYQCMMLNITEQQSMDPAFHVVFRSAPSQSAREAGWAGSVVIVRSPLQQNNGFFQVLKPNGQSAWIAANMVKPYHPAAQPNGTCVPQVLPNGRIGTGPG
jgi:hypothetical protein